MDKKIIVLFGPPGAGKGTIARYLHENFSLAHFSPGEIFRQEISKQTAIGQKVQNFLEQGELVPNHITNTMIQQTINSSSSSFNILDGYPRNLEQAHFLTQWGNLHAIIFFHLEEELIYQRLSTRYICPQGHMILPQNLNNQKICPQCLSPLKRRNDDKLEIIQKRIRIYRQTIPPLLEYYQAFPCFLHIDASATWENIVNILVKRLNLYN